MKRNIWREIKDSFAKHKILALIMVIMIVLSWILIIYLHNSNAKDLEEISYNKFMEYVDAGKIDTVYYNQSQEYMTITLLNEDTKDMTRAERDKYTYSDADKRKVLYPGSDSNFREKMLLKDINIRVVESSMWGAVGQMAFTMILYMAFFFILIRLVSSPMRRTRESDLIQTSDVSFDDIIGHEEILDDIKFITELIKNPSKGDKIGTKLPKGILFAGPPGTGKTLIAKAIAHEADVPFLYQNASGLIEMFVGLGARRVRDLFKIARKNAPCIVFIDEIDAIGGSRDSGKGSSENEQTINALLQEMDGFNSRDGIFIIAATNRPDSLDEALVRSGRFDRRIIVDPPKNWMVRRSLFEYYLNKFTVSDDIDINNLAKQVSGFTGADIAMVCNEASMIAVMKDKEAIDSACVEEAIDKKIFHGNRAKENKHESDANIVAYHEAGHAVMTYVLGEPIARASIQSTTSGVGGVVFREEPETMFRTKKDLINMVLIGYAGRASEEIKFGKDNITTGAGNDITNVTKVMMSYIEHDGFDEEFGLLDTSVLSKEHLVSGDVTSRKLSAMSNELYDKCKDILKKNYDKVEIVAKSLLENETLTGAQIEALFAEKKE